MMILQGVRRQKPYIGVCYANNPKKGGYTTLAPALDLTTSLRGDSILTLTASTTTRDKLRFCITHRRPSCLTATWQPAKAYRLLVEMQGIGCKPPLIDDLHEQLQKRPQLLAREQYTWVRACQLL